jgi:hypothetical protein
MPTPKFDSDRGRNESHEYLEPQLDPKAPIPKRKGSWVWVVLIVLLLAVLAGALILSARAQFNRDYERALNNIMLQQGNVVATLGAGK